MNNKNNRDKINNKNKNKKFVKKFVSMLLAFACVLALTGCGEESAGKGTDGKISIVTTIFPAYDFVRNIVGDRAEIKLLAAPGSEIHGYEPALSDIASITASDLFICNGGESEIWVDKVIESASKAEINVLYMTDVVTTYEEEEVEGMQHEHEEYAGSEEEHEEHSGNEHGNDEHVHDSSALEIDEHVWTSPANALAISKAIYERLCEADEANAAIYRENFEAYAEKLTALDNAYKEMTENAPVKTVIFSERFPFRYLTEEYGLNYYAAFAGCSAETEPSLSTIAFLTEKITSEEIPVVFYIEFSDHKVADMISQATGAEALMLHSCQNITVSEYESGVGYVDIMWNNYENLKKALKAETR